MINAVQKSYEGPRVLSMGELSRPMYPVYLVALPAQVEAGGTKPRPGYAVFYSTVVGKVGFQVPKANQLNETIGLVRQNPTTSASTKQVVEYDENDLVSVVLEGIVVGQAGTAVTLGDKLVYNPTDNTWVKKAAPTYAFSTASADFPANAASWSTYQAAFKTELEAATAKTKSTFTCMTPSASANELVEILVKGSSI